MKCDMRTDISLNVHSINTVPNFYMLQPINVYLQEVQLIHCWSEVQLNESPGVKFNLAVTLIWLCTVLRAVGT
jgi:hypothetical protein